MNLQSFFSSRYAVMASLGLSRACPPRLGGWLSGLVAAWIAANPQLPSVQALRANQWVVSGEELSKDQLDGVVLETLRNFTASFYSLFHYLGRLDVLQENAKEGFQPHIRRRMPASSSWLLT